MASVIEKPAFKKNYRCFAGDTWNTFILTVRYPDKTPVDFTNATAICPFKKNRNDDDANAVLTLTEMSGITLGNSVGNMTLFLTDQQTKNLGAGIFFFQIIVTQNGIIRTYADCTLTLTQ